MNFDRLAPHYLWLECLLAGGLMQRCRVAFLSKIKNCRHALLVGEGTGRFLSELLRSHPHLKITCIEHSAQMIRLARRRLVCERLDLARVQFIQVDVLHWPPPLEKFDLVVTNFFLDCFPAGQLEKLVPLLAGSATREAIWLLADFRLPAAGWRRVRAGLILAALYLFFKKTTALSAGCLTPPDPFLRAAGFTLIDRRLASFELLHSDLWQKA